MLCGNPFAPGDDVGPEGGFYVLGMDSHFSTDDRYLDRLELKVIDITEAAPYVGSV